MKKNKKPIVRFFDKYIQYGDLQIPYPKINKEKNNEEEFKSAITFEEFKKMMEEQEEDYPLAG